MKTEKNSINAVEYWIGTGNRPCTDHEEDSHQGEKPTILVVDDDARMLQSVKELLNMHGYSCTTVDGGKAALKLLAQQEIDLMLLDLNMPDVDGHQVMQEVKTHFPATDVIVVSGRTSFDNTTQALRLGAQDFLRKPYLPDELVKAIKNVLRKRFLERELEEVQEKLKASEQAHRFIVNNSPDIIYVLDGEGRFVFLNERVQTLLGFSQDELLGKHYSELVHSEDLDKAKFAINERRMGDRATRNIELRLLCKNSGRKSQEHETRSIPIDLSSMGIYAEYGDTKEQACVGTYGVARDITERKKAEEHIEHQATFDALTDLPNRRLLHDRMTQALARCRRHGHKGAVLFLDLDQFKHINDSLGHQVGDVLLQEVANRLKKEVREEDTSARIGGDEFVVLFSEISDDSGQASQLASGCGKDQKGVIGSLFHPGS